MDLQTIISIQVKENDRRIYSLEDDGYGPYYVITKPVDKETLTFYQSIQPKMESYPVLVGDYYYINGCKNYSKNLTNDVNIKERFLWDGNGKCIRCPGIDLTYPEDYHLKDFVKIYKSTIKEKLLSFISKVKRLIKKISRYFLLREIK